MGRVPLRDYAVWKGPQRSVDTAVSMVPSRLVTLHPEEGFKNVTVEVTSYNDI